MRLRELVLGALLVLPPCVQAQVGNPPAKSPYRDIRYGSSLLYTGGSFTGSGGFLGLGPHSGGIYELRYVRRLSKPLSLTVGGSQAKLERTVITFATDTTPVTRDTVPQTVTMLHAGLQFNISGGKSWRGFAPFIGFITGLAIGGSVPQETTGFDFGTKFFVAPLAGVNFYATKRIYARGELRANFWRLTYPSTYRGQADDADPYTAAQWLTSGVYLLGVGFSF